MLAIKRNRNRVKIKTSRSAFSEFRKKQKVTEKEIK